MKKRIIALLLAAMMVLSMAACGNEAGSDPAASSSQTVSGDPGTATKSTKVVISLANQADYYIGTMVGATVEAALKETGADVQVIDGANDFNTQNNQIQNAVVQGADLIYVFPAGDAEVYHDSLMMAMDAGIKTVVSNNYPGEGACDAYVGSDEFHMGAMMSLMLSKWVDETYPDAGSKEIDVLILEGTFNNTAIRRCLGMRLVGEKFLRQADVSTIDYVRTEGEPVNYIDANGNEIAVDEPTGGLILDENGHAILNPYYNEKVNLITYSDRNYTGTDASGAQAAIDNTVTNGADLKAVISYGDTGIACSTKMIELCQDGRISATDLSGIAVFCSDITDANVEAIKASVTAPETSVLRGVMAAGDLIQSVIDACIALMNGESVEAYKMEPLSYVIANADGSDIESVFYTESAQLPETLLFFGE